MIVHASIDEKGKAKNGAAGDQTGKEVCTRSWYSKPWTYMLRYKDSSIAKKAVQIAVKLAKSNLVGYDQNQRNTLYNQLVKYGWDVDKYIASGVKTETDCSAFVYACYCSVIPALRASGNAPTTSTMLSKYKSNGFTAYTGSYLTSESKLIAGDILLKPGSHVVMAVGDALSTTTTTTTTSTLDYSLVFDATYYASKYPDLKAAGITTATALKNHFINHGMSEARQAISTFNVVKYKSYYTDLQNAFGDDWVAYYKHYINHGHAEGRKCV